MSKRSQRSLKTKMREQIAFLNEANLNNTKAMEEGPIKKKWTNHDMITIRANTGAQEDMFHAWYNGKHICAHGTAGTGKTFISMYLAFKDILDGRFPRKRIIIVRSNVTTRDVGFLPGTLDEKMSQFETPYRDICRELFGKFSTYDDMKAAGLITFMPTSFVRGVTWNNAVVIVEEGQNLNFHEINSIMTRVGTDSRIIFTGDIPQSDLAHNGRDKSGMRQMIEVIKNIEQFESITFNIHDIVRSEFVKSWIIATEELVAA